MVNMIRTTSGTSGSVMVSKQTCESEFESHWGSYSISLVPHRSKELRKLHYSDDFSFLQKVRTKKNFNIFEVVLIYTQRLALCRMRELTRLLDLLNNFMENQNS